jgi:hypothetical protein
MHVAAVRQNPRFVRNIAECAADVVRDTSVDFIGRNKLDRF